MSLHVNFRINFSTKNMSCWDFNRNYISLGELTSLLIAVRMVYLLLTTLTFNILVPYQFCYICIQLFLSSCELCWVSTCFYMIISSIFGLCMLILHSVTLLNSLISPRNFFYIIVYSSFSVASLTQWTWVWVNSRSWCWAGRPGMLHPWAQKSRTQPSNWTDWTEAFLCKKWCHM